MKGKTNEGQGISLIIQSRKEIEEKIKRIEQQLNHINLQPLSISANEAKARIKSFNHLHGSDENRMSDHDRNVFKELNEDLAQKEKAAYFAKKQHKELSAELAVLKQELMDLQAPRDIGDFSIDGLRNFVLEAVGPSMEKVKTVEEKVIALEAKSNGLKEELNSLKFQIETLDEDSLLDISVEGHLTQLEKVERQNARMTAIQDLIERTEAMLKKKKQELESEKKEFADDLTYAVSVYTRKGEVKTALEIKGIIEKDEEYSTLAENLCRELLTETKTDPVNTFEGPGRTPPALTHLIFNVPLRNQMKIQVEERLKDISLRK